MLISYSYHKFLESMPLVLLIADFRMILVRLMLSSFQLHFTYFYIIHLILPMVRKQDLANASIALCFGAENIDLCFGDENVSLNQIKWPYSSSFPLTVISWSCSVWSILEKHHSMFALLFYSSLGINQLEHELSNLIALGGFDFHELVFFSQPM